ncbi:hypothetical protein BLNAU_3044 [Blattamonas nauphoetae]|uniref:Uncharacterized protein n=1 Tax=Blattamonas nauphoetae TaxID=2049346 RepID=A0ABQ9YE70_9EUKA|nr:hypothetical protein BLNAU_3044 [Blattamonas nauphoetae]
MSNRPGGVKAVLQRDGTSSLEVDGKVQATLELPTSFISALIPTRPHYAAEILMRFHRLFCMIDPSTLLMDLQIGWFAKLFDAITPSKLPFTTEFLPLHTELISVMQDYLDKIRKFAQSKEHDQIRSELDEICQSFHQKTRDYIVLLSLHPFILITQYCPNPILDFFTDFFGPDFENSVTKPFREKLRNEMDESALLSSTPPFILTSELACHVTDDEIMNVVDRIVALIETDSPIDDDTILRICAFHTNQLEYVYLPELFRKAGRSTEQYFHALNSLLSLPFDYFQLRPINCLLWPKPKTLQPTFDEWDDVDLATVGVVMPTIHENSVSFHSASSQLLKYAIDIVPQISHCAARLTLSQLERLMTPSINMITTYNLHHETLLYEGSMKRGAVFITLGRLCEQPVIAQCLSRTGFYARIIDGLLDDNSLFSFENIIDLFLRQARYSGDERAKKKILRRKNRFFLEEGWQDVLAVIFFTNSLPGLVPYRKKRAKEMMQFHGANLNNRLL